MQVSNSVAEFSPVPMTLPPSEQDLETAVAQARVLHVINGEHFSGAERVQQHLGKRLSQFGYDPIFACVKPGKFRDCCQLRDYQVIDVPMKGRFDFRIVDELVSACKQTNAKILHAHTPRTAIVTSLAARRTGLPWVYHVHSPAARDSTRGLVNRINAIIERYSIRNCDYLVTVSKSLRREMLRLGVLRSRLSVVANGVPEIEPVVTADRMHVQRWRLGMVALMRPRKGVEIALEAMKRIQESGEAIELHFIGGFETEEYRAKVQSAANSLGVQASIKWLGFSNNVAAEIRKLDAMLLPSLFGEGMPMVVLESLAAGLPVVATKVEGTPEVIRDGIEGYLAEPNDANDLADKIRAICHNRETWATMCTAALRRHRQSFSDVRMAQRVAKVYDRILTR